MSNANNKPQAQSAAPTSMVSQLVSDASLARYLTDLSAYGLLSRDEEIALAQDVERLEIAYWRALLSSPAVFPSIKDAVDRELAELEEGPPAELQRLARLAPSAARSKAPRTTRARYDRAAERLAAKLREVDIQRSAVKAAHAAAHYLCSGGEDDLAGLRPAKLTKATQRYLADIASSRRDQQQAKDRFVAANLRLVVSMARRYARTQRMPLSDLIQEGNLGLIKAVERFDYRRGFRFSTYASWWIRHALTRGLADKGRIVRLPVHALETRARVARAKRTMATRTGMRPTLAQLVEETGLPAEKVLAAEELATEGHFSLDAPVGADSDRTFVDLLRYEDETSAEDRVLEGGRKQDLLLLLQGLSPFEAQILRYRFGFEGGEERTLKEIGDMYNLSRERIRQIQALALAKMRQRLEHAEQESAAS